MKRLHSLTRLDFPQYILDFAKVWHHAYGSKYPLSYTYKSDGTYELWYYHTSQTFVKLEMDVILRWNENHKNSLPIYKDIDPNTYISKKED